MTSSSRTTALRALAGVAGVGAAFVAAAAIRHKRSTRGLTLTTEVAPNELLRTPSLRPDVSEIVTDDGATLYVRAYGPVDGDPIVFSHGWTCSTEYWYRR